MSPLWFVVPGPLAQVTGGYLFDRHIVEELRATGRPVTVVDGNDPAALTWLPDRAVAVIDGLAVPALAAALRTEAERLRLVGFVHHPLAEETGISAAEAARLGAIERLVLPGLRGILCPSRHTAAALARCGVAAERIAVTPPGTDKPAAPPRRDRPVRRLLCVANVIPRKGHTVLIDALARIPERDWHLDCVGSLERDRAAVAAVRARIAAAGLTDQVALVGEQPPDTLAAAYRAADAFVLPSYHEGFGMAFAEAMAFGLPIVATRAGAIPETVPDTAGLLVPPGDAAALRDALIRLLDEPDLARRLGAGALAHAATLSDWPSAVDAWQRALDKMVRLSPPGR
jgi:glycosyltransferase involved in cell wall biosynthesis